MAVKCMYFCNSLRMIAMGFRKIASVIFCTLLIPSISNANDARGEINFKDWLYSPAPSQRVSVVSNDKSSVLSYGGTDLTILTTKQKSCENTSVDLRFLDSRRVVGVPTKCKIGKQGNAIYSFSPNNGPDYRHVGHILNFIRRDSSFSVVIVGAPYDTRGPTLSETRFSLIGSSAALKYLKETPDPNPVTHGYGEWRLDDATMAYLTEFLNTTGETRIEQAKSTGSTDSRRGQPIAPSYVVNEEDRALLKKHATLRVTELTKNICNSARDLKFLPGTVFGVNTIDPNGNTLSQPIPALLSKMSFVCINNLARTKEVWEVWTHAAIDYDFDQVICVPAPFTEEYVFNIARDCGFKQER